MVIQRDKPIQIWGWAAPNEKVTVTLGDESRSTTAASDRSWKVELPAMPVSAESQTITVQGSDEGNYIREVHYQMFLNLREAGDNNIGYASCFDLHRAWYHPQIKVPVGERIAKWALATQYSKNIRWLPPQLQEVRANDGKLFLKLDTWAIPFNDGPIVGFAIAGKDGRFQPAQAQWLDKNAGKGEPSWERSTIVLSSVLIPEPVYFRYAWARNPLENLKSSDNAGLPFDTQRNDPFSLADMYQIYLGKGPSTPGVLNNGDKSELIQSLKAEDLKRRLDEARTLLNNQENQ
ncbi:hypothetical protein [Novipirellula artificiosorum]|uniref:Uncharacterized protein n=1 Tax=Novipirellula artificiosorum TaxID=2528016 RepID=A0A5C6D0N2_9BACT|nr:hypothetical protein [Novipirellula artificiosorum]TWU30693.1 hypothetical protein Poly41_65980 [Novipirellula artificiosorum]